MRQILLILLDLYLPDWTNDVSQIFWIFMLLSLLAVLYFIFFTISFQLKLWNETNRIKKVTNILYEDFDKNLDNKGILHCIFMDFRKTVNQDCQKRNYLSTHSENFLNELDGSYVLVNYGNFNETIAKYIPSFCTSLGILGTFVGIVLGLSGLDIGGGAKTLQDSISVLVSGAALSFKTSLWGITISIFFSLFFNLFLNFIESDIRRFKKTIKYEIGLKTRENFEESQQTNLLEGIKGSQDRLATNIADAFQKSVTDQIIPGLALKFDELSFRFTSLETSMKENFDVLNQKFADVIIKNSLELRGALTQNISSLLVQEEKSGERLHKALESQHETLRTSHEQIKELLDNTAKKQQESFDIQKQAMEASQSQFKELIQNITESQKEFFQAQMLAANDAQKQTGEIIREKITSGTQQEVINLQTALSQLTDSMQRVLEKSDESMKTNSSMLTEIMSNWQTSMSSQKEMSLNTQDLTDSFVSIIGSLNLATEKLSLATSQIDSKILQGVSNVNEQVGSIAGRLSDFSTKQFKTISEQQDTVNTLNDTINKTLTIAEKQQNAQLVITNELNKLDQKLERISTYYSDISKNFKNYSENITDFNRTHIQIFNSFKEYQNFLNKTMMENAGAFSNIVKDTGDLMKSIDKDIVSKTKDTTEKLEKVSAQLGGLVQAYNEFSKAEKQSQEIWMTYKKQFENLNKDMQNAFIGYINGFSHQVEKTTQSYDESIGKAVSHLSSIVGRLEELIGQNSSIFTSGTGRR